MRRLTLTTGRKWTWTKSTQCQQYTKRSFTSTSSSNPQDTLSNKSKQQLDQKINNNTLRRPLPRYQPKKGNDKTNNKFGMEYFVDIGEDGLLEKPLSEYVDPKHNPVKSRLTALAADLQNQITLRGPLSLSDWISRCMQDANHGYYMTKESLIGGDFVTSPEISQLFGELIAVWLYDTWSKLGEPLIVDLVELGPGHGTLMADVLRTLRHFPKLYNGLTAHLVETSPIMRRKQQEALKVKLADSDSVFASTTNKTIDQIDSASGETISGFTESRNRVVWHHSMKSVPTSNPILLLAHEFFDALPVYQFQYTKQHGWCEVIVDTDFTTDSPHHFRFALTPGPTPVAYAYMGRKPGREGDRVEVQAVAVNLMEEIAARLASQGGAALVIDYGFVDRKAENVDDFTLQAVQNHQFVHPLHEPGLVDLTTLVNFVELETAVDRYALMNNKSIVALPVIHQSTFLRNMHIGSRLEALVEAVPENEHTEVEIEKLVSAAARLIDEKQMGALFKVMAIVPESIAQQVSAWWEDDRTSAKISKRAAQSELLHSMKATKNNADKKN